MTIYKFNAQVTISVYTEVEADSASEALEIAKEREVGQLCHNAVYPDCDEAWFTDELDGQPEKITLNEVSDE